MWPTVCGNARAASCQVCDVFVCSMWKAGGVFKAIDNDFSDSNLPREEKVVLVAGSQKT